MAGERKFLNMKKETWLVRYARRTGEETAGNSGMSVGDSENEESENYAEDRAAADLVNDLKHYPHAFVLGCIMDAQIKADNAWRIPHRIRRLLKGDFSLETLCRKSPAWYRKAFAQNSLHRFNNEKAEAFYLAVHKIKDEYGGDASRIWAGRPSTKEAEARFRAFKGAGQKISSMAVNILKSCYGIVFDDDCVDISPDTHVITVFKRYGLVPQSASKKNIIERARELNPEYPGVLDHVCYEVGVNFCRARNPDCEDCPLESHCPKLIEAPKKAPAHKARRAHAKH
jgi:endonuclease III